MRRATLARAVVGGLALAALLWASSGPAWADPVTADDVLVLEIVPWHRDFCQLILRGRHLEPGQSYSLAVGLTTIGFFSRPNGTLLQRYHDHRAAWNMGVVSSMSSFTLTMWDGATWTPWAPGAVAFARNTCAP